MSKITTITRPNGDVYNVRLVEKGDHHGLNFGVVHDEDRPMVEFYDTDHEHTYDFVGTKEEAIAAGARCLGQFVTYYYVETLMEDIETTTGLCLQGGVPKWCVEGDLLREAFRSLGLLAPAKKIRLVVVYDSEDPDMEPQLWVPADLAATHESVTLNKSQELGGVYPNTDPANIVLLDAGTNASFPNYKQI